MLSPLAAVATPYGADIGAYYRSVLGNTAIRQNVNIWGPWSPHSFFSIHFAATALLAATAVVWAMRRGHRPNAVPAALAAGTLVAGVYAIRYQVWFAIPGSDRRSGGPRLHVRRRTHVIRADNAASGRRRAARGGGHLRGRARGHLDRHVPARRSGRDGDSRLSDHAAHTLHPRLADYAVAPALLWQHPELAGRVGFDTRFEIYRATPARGLVPVQRRRAWMGRGDQRL